MNSKILIQVSSLIVGLVMMCAAGTMYSFDTWSGALRKHNDYTFSELTIIRTFGFLGVSFGAPAGIILDFFGPKRTSVLAATISAIGYFLLWASFFGWVANHVGFISFVFFIIGQGNILTYMPALIAQIRNFPAHHRGKVVGVVDSMFGASSAIFAAIYKYHFANPSGTPSKHDIPDFMILLALVSVGANFLGAIVLRYIPKLERVQKYDDHASIGINAERVSLLPEKIVNITGLQLLSTANFWIVTGIFTLTIGVSLNYLNNMFSILQSVRDLHNVSVLMLIMPISSCVTRLLTGMLSDLAIHHMTRASYQLFAAVLMLVSQIMMAVALTETIIASSLILGIATGMLWCITPTVVSEMFGVPHLGQNWGWSLFGSGLAAVLLQLVTNVFYANHTKENDLFCHGEECYRNTFIITSCCCFVACILAIVNVKRTKKEFHVI